EIVGSSDVRLSRSHTAFHFPLAGTAVAGARIVDLRRREPGEPRHFGIRQHSASHGLWLKSELLCGEGEQYLAYRLHSWGTTMSDIWFTADFHLGHVNILKYCDRPF